MFRFRSLTFKLIFIGVIMFGLLTFYITSTYIFTYHMEGEAKRISLVDREKTLIRSMSHQIMHMLDLPLSPEKEMFIRGAERIMAEYGEILYGLRDGSERLGLKPMPEYDKESLSHLNTLIELWQKTQKSTLLDTLKIPPERKGEACQKCHSTIRDNIGKVDALVRSLEKHHEKELKDFDTFRLYIFGFSFIATLCIILFVRQSVIMPVRRLKDAAREIEKGNFDVKLDVKNIDEIGESARAFNSMSETIKTRDKALTEQFWLISRSKNEWQNTIDSITDLVSIHDRDFNIIRANMAFAKHFGFHPREVINKKCYEVIHGTGSPVANCPCRTTLDENQPVTKEVHDPKTNRIFLVSTFPFYSSDRELIGSVYVAKDVTEEKEKEMRLIITERLASLGQMASGIAHEINNPLSAIAGCAEGLLNRVKKGRFEPELFENYLKIISEEIIRCKGITTSMLSFVRKTTYEKKEININETLNKTLEIIGFQGRLQQVEIKRDYREGIIIHGSEGELRQVFLSIISNALDAMNDTGTITLETDREGDTAFVKISDTGPGIPQEYLNRIFDPFFTTRSDKGGTGLGLSIANKIITNHNGAINVMSEEGNGTTFRIILPSK